MADQNITPNGQFPPGLPPFGSPQGPTTQQKRQHSSSYQMPNTLKRSVTQPASPSLLPGLSNSNRATLGTLTPADGSLFPQARSPPVQQAMPPHQIPIPQQFNIQQQVPQFKPSFDITVKSVSPQPQLPAKSKKFSQTFVNQTYKGKGPDIPQSPNLSVSRAKYDTTSYLNDDRTDVNDFPDTNSLAYSNTVQTTNQPPAKQIYHQQATRQNPPHPSQLPPPTLTSNPTSLPPKSATPSVLMKDNAESPGSTISEASNPVMPAVQAEQSTSKLSDEEQQLITKLQDTYKAIIRLENTLQRKCAGLNLPQRLDMTELWEIYNIDIQLLNAYYDFLLYSMGSGKSGKQIVEVYRIPRRLWVYGIVTFLDVLKNVVSVFIEHDICSSFIGYAFNILSGLSDLHMDGWLCEKLGDLSRMAIALYPSRHIDWKISAEYWYSMAMTTQYGFGKVYYHVATVQMDNLDALVNIGKSVFCRDTFVPTPQYMRMVIDNINQRSYVDLPVLDFIKVHKILLSNEIVNESELNKLITYYARNLGVDNNNVDFFTRKAGHFSEDIESPEYSQDNDYSNKFNFWFQRGSSFALVNIFQMVGFGNAANPFARLFGLPEALRERKERKERKDKRKKSVSGEPEVTEENVTPDSGEEPIRELSVKEWFETNANLNKFAVKVAMKMMIVYLKGPLITGLPFVTTMLYFLVAVGEAMKKHPNSKPFMETIILTIIPLNSLIAYLNEVLKIVINTPVMLNELKKHTNEPDFFESGFLKHFNENENLHEVWKCWGSLWYDSIFLKEEYESPRAAGLCKEDILDVPIGGTLYEKKYNTDRFVRVVLLASYVADNFNFGIKRFANNRFGFHVDKVFRGLDDDEDSREFVKKAYMEIFREARSFDLVETVDIDPECTTVVKGDIYPWIEAAGAEVFKIYPETVNYADNDADYEEDEDDSEEYHTNTTAEVAGMDLTESLPSSIIKAESGIYVGMDLTYFVLDTNMWLKHCGRLFKCVRSHLFKLVVPLVVFQELRSLRCSPDATIADAGTRAVITLRQLASEGAVVPLKMNGTEASSLNDVTDFESNKTWMQSIDDTIINATRLLSLHLNAVYEEKKKHDPILEAVSFTVLITEDRNMRLKSRTKNVAAFQGKWFFDVLSEFSQGRICDN